MRCKPSNFISLTLKDSNAEAEFTKLAKIKTIKKYFIKTNATLFCLTHHAKNIVI